MEPTVTERMGTTLILWRHVNSDAAHGNWQGTEQALLSCKASLQLLCIIFISYIWYHIT